MTRFMAPVLCVCLLPSVGCGDDTYSGTPSNCVEVGGYDAATHDETGGMKCEPVTRAETKSGRDLDCEDFRQEDFTIDDDPHHLDADDDGVACEPYPDKRPYRPSPERSNKPRFDWY